MEFTSINSNSNSSSTSCVVAISHSFWLCYVSPAPFLSDCSYFTGISGFTPGNVKTKGPLKGWTLLGWRSRQCAADCWCFQCWSTLKPHRPPPKEGMESLHLSSFCERPLVRLSNNILSRCCYFGCSFGLVILISPLKISLAPCQVFIQVRAKHLQWSVKLASLKPANSFFPYRRLLQEQKQRLCLWSANSQLCVQVCNYPMCSSCCFTPFTQPALIWRAKLSGRVQICHVVPSPYATWKTDF